MGGGPRPNKTNHQIKANNFRPVQHKLKFDVKEANGSTIPLTQDLSNLESLAALRRIERDPSHLWDEDERELLTVLYRWYNNADPSTIPKVFNAVTGLSLRLSVVRYQFESHILLYGGRAFPEFARVMSVPFDDPEGRYDEIRGIIEDTAAEPGINLPRRETEVHFTSGTARYAKSPRTRRTYRALVRKATQQEKEKARIARMSQLVELPACRQPASIPYRLGRIDISMHPDQMDKETWSDVEDSPSSSPLAPITPGTRTPPAVRNIAFRVWDANSRTAFTEESGFVSQAFTIWRNEYPPPFSPDGQGRQALMIFTNLHLSLTGGASTFVSLSTSLLQVLVKASTMHDPRIAVERMVWCAVPAEAILWHFPLSHLHEVCEADDACAELLSLADIERGLRTRHVAARMQQRCKSINDIVAARAMAVIARAFGVHRPNARLEHIQGMIAALVDSLQLSVGDAATPIPSRVAHAFAATLKSERHGVENVASAFLAGVQQGVDTTAYYAHRRPK
ncbi:uncharacterized protein SETTUDRAFT_99205 [Exserohilum turcica Et28A]|uniref:DUF7587 domain-containing protein n=1 Tax=Exserohilum turcicum (strain 28A) TaxID=671987 RepID=R0I719_EXST2|nr:uncharacterized protein SETTUDRAFT_99205 [Exserohilum turcica Et28A]EOA81370.1 hypothetical protein SETTUDRAFT_99205 [Exserohilum turcica Et28A]